MAHRLLYWTRAGFSLLLASPLALVLLIHPAAMLDGQGGYSHPS